MRYTRVAVEGTLDCSPYSYHVLTGSCLPLRPLSLVYFPLPSSSHSFLVQYYTPACIPVTSLCMHHTCMPACTRPSPVHASLHAPTHAHVSTGDARPLRPAPRPETVQRGAHRYGVSSLNGKKSGGSVSFSVLMFQFFSSSGRKRDSLDGQSEEIALSLSPPSFKLLLLTLDDCRATTFFLLLPSASLPPPPFYLGRCAFWT